MFSQFTDALYDEEKTLIKIFDDLGFERTQDAVDYLKNMDLRKILYQKVGVSYPGERKICSNLLSCL